MRWTGTGIFFLFAVAFCASVSAQTQPPSPGQQAAQHRCELSPDRRIVSLSVSNPSASAAECSVNCHLPYQGGVATVTCTRILPAGAAFVSLCAHGREKNAQYSRLERSDATCSVSAVPAAPPAEKRFKEWEELTLEERQFEHFRRQQRR